jgi:hypothetical protein
MPPMSSVMPLIAEAGSISGACMVPPRGPLKFHGLPDATGGGEPGKNPSTAACADSDPTDRPAVARIAKI